MKQIQINQKSIEKSKISTKKIREPNVLRLLPNVCDFQKENHTLEYGFKNLYKIYSLVNGFLYYVISILCDFHLKKDDSKTSVGLSKNIFWSYMVYLTPADSF